LVRKRGSSEQPEQQPNKKKVRRGEKSSTPVANKAKKSSIDDTNPFLPPGVTPSSRSDSKSHQLPTASVPIMEEKSQKAKQKHSVKSLTKQKPTNQKATPVRAAASTSKSSAFALNLGLPVTSFSVPGVDKDITLSSSSSSSPTKPIPVDPKAILPTSTEEGLKWKDLVELTRAHPRFESKYNFSSKRDSSSSDVESGEELPPSTWMTAKPFGGWCKSNPHAIAIDCEMCATKDPDTGKIDPKALCRLSVVNAVNPDEVLIDTLVKPKWPVIDYRTWVNGIEANHLDNVQFTIEHAQAFMKALCSQETVIIGHAVHNDLEALNFEHYCVVDSAMILKVKDDEERTPSLKDAVKTLLEKDMPKTHDSVNDARAALSVMEHYLSKEGNVAPIIATNREKISDKLFIHRIPRICREEHIKKMIEQYSNVIPLECEPIVFNGNTGKTHVTFQSTKHAFLAFDAIKGTAKPDKSGRLQKKIYMRNSDYVQVRLMVRPRTTNSDEKNPPTSNADSST